MAKLGGASPNLIVSGAVTTIHVSQTATASKRLSVMILDSPALRGTTSFSTPRRNERRVLGFDSTLRMMIIAVVYMLHGMVISVVHMLHEMVIPIVYRV